MNILQNREKIYKVSAAVAAVSFAISLLVWSVRFPGVRRVFVFESADTNRLCVEARYLTLHPVQGKVGYYVDELLLGPETERCRPLFSPGTKNLSCFQRRGILYVNISDESLKELSDSSNIKKGTELFRKNILRNFRGIHAVEMYIDTKHVYENDRIVKKALTKKKS